MGERSGSVRFRDMYRGPMDKYNMGRIESGKWGVDRSGESNGEQFNSKIEKQFKKKKII